MKLSRTYAQMLKEQKKKEEESALELKRIEERIAEVDLHTQTLIKETSEMDKREEELTRALKYDYMLSLRLICRIVEEHWNRIKGEVTEKQRDQATALDNLRAQLKLHVKTLRDWKV